MLTRIKAFAFIAEQHEAHPHIAGTPDMTRRSPAARLHKPTHSAAEPMSSIDRAWLGMDRPRNPMVLAALLELDGVQKLQQLIDTIRERLLEQPRFRQHPATDRNPAAWIDDSELDRDYHFSVHRLDARHWQVRLRAAIATEMATGLDAAKPLWRLCFYRGPRRKVAVLFRAHHAMADGVSLLRLLLKLADGAERGQCDARVAAPEARSRLAAAADTLKAADATWSLLRERLSRFADDPIAQWTRLRFLAAGGLDLLRTLGTSTDRLLGLAAPLTGERRMDWSAPVPLSPMADAARARQVKLNDLLLAALSGAFRSHLEESGPIRPDQVLRVSIPVNLRALESEALGNCFGLLLFDLPVGERDRNQRLRRVAQQMQALKHGGQAQLMLASLEVAGYLPVSLERRIVDFVAGKAAAVVSNLRGPEAPLRFAGADLKSAVFWPPQTGGVGIGVSLLSYVGKVTLGLSADASVMPATDAFMRQFALELDRLCQAE